MKLKKGFTLIELLVVIAIIGILVAIVLSSTRKIHACGFFSDCTTDTSNVHTFIKEQAQTEVNQRKLDVAQPAPTLENSTERQNLIARLKLFNNPNKASYIYLLSYGKVMAFFTIKGKVSSVNSLLTTPTQLIYGNGAGCDQYCNNVPSPDLDGTYGSNGPEGSVFFFTTDGAYVEWHGDYMMSDQPLKLSTQPELVREIK